MDYGVKKLPLKTLRGCTSKKERNSMNDELNVSKKVILFCDIEKLPLCETSGENLSSN